MSFRSSLVNAVLGVLCLAQLGCEGLLSKANLEPTPFTADVVDEFKLDEPGEMWTLHSPKVWRIGTEGERRFLRLGEVAGRPQSSGWWQPRELAVYNKYQFRSFNFSCRVRRETSQPAAADICIIFGRQDASHFYCLRLASVAGRTQQGLVRKDGESLAWFGSEQSSSEPALLDNAWHKIDIQRDAKAGTIDVYLDEAKSPWLHAVDRTYLWGHIAVGSFAGQVSFGRVLMSGEAREVRPAPLD